MASEIREFGTVISGNRRRCQDLTPAIRASIITAVAAGQKKAHVAAALGVSRRVVYTTLHNATTRPSLESLRRPERPRKLNPTEVRYIKRLIQKNPRIGWATAKHQATTTISIQRTTTRSHSRLRWERGGQPNVGWVLDQVPTYQVLTAGQPIDPHIPVWTHLDQR